MDASFEGLGAVLHQIQIIDGKPVEGPVVLLVCGWLNILLLHCGGWMGRGAERVCAPGNTINTLQS